MPALDIQRMSKQSLSRDRRVSEGITWFWTPFCFNNCQHDVWSVSPFRAKPPGWFGSPRPYVHVPPSRQPALARTQGILESAQRRALLQYSVVNGGVADSMSVRRWAGDRDETQGLATLVYIRNAPLDFGSCFAYIRHLPLLNPSSLFWGFP